MRNMMMTPSPLKRESFASNSHPNRGSISMGTSFDSSFSTSGSSNASWDQCYTPTSQNFSLSRRQSAASIDIEGLSSSRSSLTGSVSPSDETFLPMNSFGSITQNMLSSMPQTDSKFFLYATPDGKVTVDPNMLDFNYQNVDINIYSPLEHQDFLSDGLPTLSFDSSSPLPLGSSPLPPGSSPHSHQYVDPSHTTFEPLCPSTPLHFKGSASALGSPLEYDSGSRPTPGYFQHFMSPPNTYTHSRSSPLSSKTASTVRRMPPTATLESSTALHRIQSSGASTRVRKPSQRKAAVDIVQRGRYQCDFKDCKTKKPFMRHEHLKRHKKTHLGQKNISCEFCEKKFQQDRSDNYRSHVKLHAKPKKGNQRTQYFPEAAALVKSWEKEKERKTGGPKNGLGESALLRNTRRTLMLQSSPDTEDDMEF